MGCSKVAIHDKIYTHKSLLKMNSKNFQFTSDKLIRTALKEKLGFEHKDDPKLKIIEELGIKHGTARVDIAVVNGVLHGYEIKSDLDTLQRLPEQMNIYNSVFTQMTIVVGKIHLYEAINAVPDWWGITVAKIDTDNSVVFNCIREAGKNLNQDSVSVARLLWRDEALQILEGAGEAYGLRSKPRRNIYEKLATVFDRQVLEDKVRETIFIREAWRSDSPLVLNGGLSPQ